MRVNKPMLLSLLLLLTLAMLTSCGSMSKPRLMQPTPTIVCNEHAPSEKLPPYPARGASSADAYTVAQSLWAIEAAGVVQRNNILRDGIAACLDEYRKRGVIL